MATNKDHQSTPQEQVSQPMVSVFRKGYVNKYGRSVLQVRPMKDTTLFNIYRYVVGPWAKTATEQLRLITDHEEAQKFKKLNFMFFTPNGTFAYRKAQDIKERSQLMVIDIDGLKSDEEVKEIRSILLNDESIETAMLFVSPSGLGLKWIIVVGDMQGLTHKQYFKAVSNYLEKTHGIMADQSGSDLCRACYLPYDPECFINDKYIINYKITKS